MTLETIETKLNEIYKQYDDVKKNVKGASPTSEEYDKMEAICKEERKWIAAKKRILLAQRRELLEQLKEVESALDEI